MNGEGDIQILHGIESGEGFVSAWSTTRLPFEPRGDLKVFRDELRSAIRQLRAADDEGLVATYSSPVREFCDVENVLIYNVGTSAFTNSARNELGFQRSFEPRDTREHKYRYEILPRPIKLGSVTEPVARWRSGELEGLSETTGLTSLWWSIRHGDIEVGQQLEVGAPVRIELEVRGPRQINLASVVKAAVDASVVAVQEPQLAEADEPARRIATRLGVPLHRVEEALLDPRNRVFAQGPVVRLRGEAGVHWNPADDACLAGIIRYRASPQWELRGELFLI